MMIGKFTGFISDIANSFSAQYSLNQNLIQIIFAVITIFAVFFAIRVAKNVIRFVLFLIALFGIAMTLYGHQIIDWIAGFINKL